MSRWKESIVQIMVGGRKGSGVFISETEILTAAHVISPNGELASLNEIVVDLRFVNGSQGAVAHKARVLDEWTEKQRIGADLGLIGVTQFEKLGLKHRLDAPEAGNPLDLLAGGFVGTDDRWDQSRGSVSKSGRLLFSAEIKPQAGMSGGPMVFEDEHKIQLVGIITFESPNGFVGLPITRDALDELRSP